MAASLSPAQAFGARARDRLDDDDRGVERSRGCELKMMTPHLRPCVRVGKSIMRKKGARPRDAGARSFATKVDRNSMPAVDFENDAVAGDVVLNADEVALPGAVEDTAGRLRRQVVE